MNSRHKKAQQFLKQGLFDKINNFADLESRIEQLETKQMRGDAFEVFAQGYLATQKIVQAKSVWTFEDIPSRLMREIFIETPGDMGVDGVYKTVTDDRCAYQVKFRSRRANLQWSDLSTFMGLSEQADLRVLFTNSEKIPDLMDQRSKFYCIRGSDLDALKPNDFETIKTWLKAGRVKHKPHKPRPHQKAALREIKKVFKDADRAALVMACGTGKTLVALWAAEQSEANNILVLVPSLALVRQLLHEWLKHTTKWGNPSFMCVCSDPTVTRGDEVIVKQSELDFPVSTDSEDVSRYLKSRVEGPRIIFSTYQSAQVVADGMPDPFKFDLGFFDEAHKTAGRVGTKFAFALTDDNLKIKKLLFMTATPRHYDVRKKNKEGDSKFVYSMDATEVYGKVAYKLPFRQAVDEGLICDYEVLISVVTNAEINDWVLSHGEVLVKGDLVKARQVANQVALMNAISGHNISKIITFHSSVASAKSFTSPGGEGINSMVMNLIALHVNGSMPAAKRSAVMREFERSEFLTLISNARCMIEGVDVPAVDMVAFLSPKKSKVDIVQATGRAMRLSDNKKVGYLLVPLYLEQGVGESIDEAVERADFGEVWNVLQAMKEQDEELDDVIKVIQEERGKTGGYDDSRLTERIEVLGPALNLATLRNAVVTSCVERLGDTWDLRFGELVAYKKEHGDCNVPQSYSKNPQLAFWVNTQRTHHKKGYLQPKRISRLEEIGFDWDPKDSEWEQRFSELVSYKDEYGHCNVPRGYAENPQLGTWVKVQRRS